MDGMAHDRLWWRCVALLLFAIPAAGTATANDGYGALGLGGLVLEKSEHIAMARELLDISYRRITVTYEFVNESDKDITTDVSFPIPVYRADYSEGGTRGTPHGFAVVVDGKPLPYVTQVRAFLEDDTRSEGRRDITAVLREAGLTDRQIMCMPFDGKLVDSDHQLLLPEKSLRLLRERGVFDGSVDWSISVAYQWRQTFPAHRAIRVEHSYVPLVAFGKGVEWSPGEDSSNLQKEYCADAPFLASLEALATKRVQTQGQAAWPTGLPGTAVGYILKTANSWKDGVRDFELRVHKGAPSEIISFCFPGKVQKVDATTFSSRIANFRPTEDLLIYFGNLEDETYRKLGGMAGAPAE
jgi:hypothetical protein